jgi:chemotaxis protein histidine kinase CheA
VRHYPHHAAPHLLGYIGEVDEKMLKENEEYELGDYIGKSGLEKAYERALRGKRGIRYVLVDVHGRTYALPLAAVVESLKFNLAEVHRINGRDTLRLRDRIVPLVRLSTLIGFAGAETGTYAVVLGRGDKRVGLVVDRLHGQQEVVIKALDPAVSGGAVPVAGATIMGDGRVVLILDVAALFEGKRQALIHGRAQAPALPGA